MTRPSADDREFWQRAIGAAEADERQAERDLARLSDERSKWMRGWQSRREAVKRELRDAIKAKKSAAFALKTGREPR